MLYLILLTFGIFFIFWIGDFVLTLKIIKKVDYKVEINPIIRLFVKYRGNHIYFFKILEILIFGYLIFYLTKLGGNLPFYILLGFIFLYSLLVLNNANVYYLVTKKEATIFKFIFMLTVMVLLFFMYLNYLLYSDLIVAYDAIDKSNLKYNELYQQYIEENMTTNVTKPITLEQILEDFDLPIRH